ncbi:MAG TPA: 2-dehydropantoate 2-reductase [Candidatus Limnocylindrales bacterium]|jgi:2-dehydropantoate 2-reductase
MRVLVVGAGAVGSLLAFALARGGADVTLVRRQHIGGPSSGPIDVRRRTHRLSVRVDVVAHPTDARTPDVILIAVKQFDLPEALESIKSFPSALLVTPENGIGAEEVALAARPEGRLIAASVTASVARLPDDGIEWLTTGGIGLAAAHGDVLDVATSLAATLGLGGLPAAILPSAAAMKWSKLLANVVGNATSALLDLDPAVIYADRHLFRVERRQLLEVLAVMRARGLRTVDLPGARISLLASAVRLPEAFAWLALTRVVRGARGGKDPSLRVALAAGGPTEVAWLNGAVAAAADEMGLAAPINAGLSSLVAEATLDGTRRAWFRGRPARLLDALRMEGPDRQ